MNKVIYRQYDFVPYTKYMYFEFIVIIRDFYAYL